MLFVPSLFPLIFFFLNLFLGCLLPNHLTPLPQQKAPPSKQTVDHNNFASLSQFLHHVGDVVVFTDVLRTTWFDNTDDIGTGTARPHVVLVSFGGPAVGSASAQAMSVSEIEQECDLFGGSVTQLDLSTVYTQLKRTPSPWQKLNYLSATLPAVFRCTSNPPRHLAFGSLSCPVAFSPAATAAPQDLALQLQPLSTLNVLAFVPNSALR